MHEIIGKNVRDKITGAEGLCVGRSEHLFKAPMLEIVGRDIKNGMPFDSYWLYESRCEVVPREKKIDILEFRQSSHFNQE